MGFEQITGPNFFAEQNVIAGTGLSSSTTGGSITLAASLTATSASLGSNVVIANTTSYFDGPSVAQGTVGTWFASGQVTLGSTTLARTFSVKLWDGATVVDSCQTSNAGASSFFITATLSGFITSPAGNLRLSVQQVNGDGIMFFNASGNSKDSTISAIRIA